MQALRPATSYTDTREMVRVFLPGTLIALALLIPAAIGGHFAFAIYFLLLNSWPGTVVICHFLKNGKQVSLTISDDGVRFGDGSSLTFHDVEKISIVKQLPQLPVRRVSIIFHLRPDVQLKQGARSLRYYLMLSEVHGDTSSIDRQKMVCYTSPGLRIHNGPVQIDEQVGEDLLGRFHAFQERARG